MNSQPEQIDRAPEIAKIVEANSEIEIRRAQELAKGRLATWPDPENWSNEEIALDILHVELKRGAEDKSENGIEHRVERKPDLDLFG